MNRVKSPPRDLRSRILAVWVVNVFISLVTTSPSLALNSNLTTNISISGLKKKAKHDTGFLYLPLLNTSRTLWWFYVKRRCYLLSHVQLFMTPWTAARQPPLPMEFSRQGYSRGFPFPPPGDLPHPRIEPGLLHYKQILYQLSCQGSPRILEWVALSFSRGSSRFRDRIQVSHIAGSFFTFLSHTV